MTCLKFTIGVDVFFIAKRKSSIRGYGTVMMP